jgi:hypothetical protein
MLDSYHPRNYFTLPPGIALFYRTTHTPSSQSLNIQVTTTKQHTVTMRVATIASVLLGAFSLVAVRC